MNEQGMRFRIGVFVLAALILLAVLITLFGSLPTLFKRHSLYVVHFQDATGVGPGTPVRRSGVRIGEVQSLDLNDETGEVTVRLLIGKQHTIYHDEVPTLVQGLLGGDTNIDFIRRRPEPAAPPPEHTAVEPGEEMNGVRQPGMTSLVSQAAEVVPTTQETLNEIRKSLEKFDRMAPLMEETLKEYRDLGRATREMIPELRRTNLEVQELAKSARDTVPELRQTNAEVQALAKATRETIPELRRTNEEILVTARNWGRLGERLDVLLQANQEKLVKTLESLNEVLMRVGNVFTDENQRNLAATLKNVRAGTDNLDSISKNTDELLKESRQTVKRVNDSLVRTNEVLDNLQMTTKPLAERSGSIAKNLDESTVKFNLLLTDLRALLGGLNQGDGTLRRFLNDPSLYNNVNEVACQLARTLPRLDRVLRDMEVFADKIARHPESLGLGGVVSPSSGLKDGPSGWSRPQH